MRARAAPPARLFELLAWRAGALALGGVAAVTAAFPFCAAFPELSLAQREAVLLSWANSPLFLFRKARARPPPAAAPCSSRARRWALSGWPRAQAFKGVKSLLLNTVLCAVDAHGRNPIWPVLEYPGERPAAPPRAPRALGGPLAGAAPERAEPCAAVAAEPLPTATALGGGRPGPAPPRVPTAGAAGGRGRAGGRHGRPGGRRGRRRRRAGAPPARRGLPGV